MADIEALPIRSYRAGDESCLVELFAAVFGRHIDEQHWRWKLHAPDSPVPNVLLATSGDRPVFQYAGILTAFELDGARRNGMVSVDTMTAPDFRRRGLLTRVATEAYSRWRDAGIEFVFGLPNEQWGSRAAALGWLPLFPLRRMVRPLRPEALLAHRFALPWLSSMKLASSLWNGIFARLPPRDPSLAIQAVARAGPEFDRLWASCRGNAKFGVVRDRAWVQWRFLDCPSRRYRVRLATRAGEPAGYCAYAVYDSGSGRRAVIAELAAPDGDAATRRTLLADVLRELLAEDVGHVTSLAVPGAPIYRDLRAAGFFGGPAFSVQIVPLNPALPIDELRRAENWDLSGAAFDVI